MLEFEQDFTSQEDFIVDHLYARDGVYHAALRIGSLFQTGDGATRGAEITPPNTLVTDGQRRVIFVPEPDGNGSPHASFGYAVDEGRDVSTELTIAVGNRLELKACRLSCWRRPSKKPNLQDTGDLMSTNPPCIL